MHRYLTTSRSQQVLCVVGIAALAALVIFTGIPRSTIFMHVLHKTGHPLAFGAIAVLSLLLLQSGNSQTAVSTPTSSQWRSYAAAFAIAIALGVFTEIAQLFTNRNSSAIDVLRDAGGAIAALGLFSTVIRTRSISPRSQVRKAALLLGVLATSISLAPLAWCAAAYINREVRFPVIAAVVTPLDQYFITGLGDSIATTPISGGQTMGERAMVVAFGDRTSSGIQITEPHPDWRGYRALIIDITNTGENDFPLSFRVHDRQHNWSFNDRFNRTVVLKAMQRQNILIWIADIERAPRDRLMDLSHIANVAVFVWQPQSSGQFIVHRIALE